MLIPIVLFLLYALLPGPRRKMIKDISLAQSLLTQFMRIPVEITLYLLFLRAMVPKIMTFAGWNFDIVFAFSAFIIGLICSYKKIGTKGLIIWNIIGICFVVFIFVIGVLSSPVPFQQFAFDQPNTGVLVFPYVLLPTTIVPLAIYLHLCNITLLVEMQKKFDGKPYADFPYRNFKYVKNPLEKSLMDFFSANVLEPKKEKLYQSFFDILTGKTSLFRENSGMRKILLEIDGDPENLEFSFVGVDTIQGSDEYGDIINYGDYSVLDLNAPVDVEINAQIEKEIDEHADEYAYLIADSEKELRDLNAKAQAVDEGLTVQRASDLDAVELYFHNLKLSKIQAFVIECWAKARRESCVTDISLEMKIGDDYESGELPF